LDDWEWPLEGSPLGQEISSEIDWMRFFWQLITADEGQLGASMSFWEVGDVLGYTRFNYPWDGKGALYCNLFNSLIESGLDDYEDRFVDLTEINGVYYDSPSACTP
jgi:hypothetical protein